MQLIVFGKIKKVGELVVSRARCIKLLTGMSTWYYLMKIQQYITTDRNEECLSQE